MKKIRLLTVLLLTVMLMLTAGCSSDKAVEDTNNTDSVQDVEEKYADEEFLNDFVKALVSRWEYKPDYEYETGSDDHYNYFKELVDIERTILSKYRDEKFENSKLSLLANSYLDGLDKQDEALSYLKSDYEHYRSLWNAARDQRSICIKNVYDEASGFTVPARHERTLYHMLTAAYIAQNYDDVYNLFNNPIKNGEYKLEGSTLSVSILNTTDFDFRELVVYSDLYSNGTLVGYGEVMVESWKPGEVYDYVFTLQPGVGFDFVEITLN